MRKIVLMQFGSHVYGTNVPESDHDFKGVFIPSPQDIILQRAPKTIVRGTKADKTARNTAEDEDLELFSLQQYLKLLMDGQTVTLDMMFTPSEFYREVDPIWTEVVRNKERFFSRKSAAFIGYCRMQANKYGIKGSRVGAARYALEVLNSLDGTNLFGGKLRVIDVWDRLTDLFKNKEHIGFVTIQDKQGRDSVYLEVCNRKFQPNNTIFDTAKRIKEIVDEYGHRALLAEKNKGVDWKALMHAVRVSYEAIEFLGTGKINQPRPERELLLKIRKGELPYKEVATLIEELLISVQQAEEKSQLAIEPDYAFADDFVEYVYRKEIEKM